MLDMVTYTLEKAIQGFLLLETKTLVLILIYLN
jgi:hypothetical protein